MILDHVQLAGPRGCEDEARRFYGDLLGLEEIPKPEPMLASGGVWFRVGSQELHIGIEEPFAPARKAHPGLRVEAALDDLNIDRFLQLIGQFSDRAQFVIVTHQKRTMDAADTLYGVSMGADGISRVISRKLGGQGVEAVAENGAGPAEVEAA